MTDEQPIGFDLTKAYLPSAVRTQLLVLVLKLPQLPK